MIGTLVYIHIQGPDCMYIHMYACATYTFRSLDGNIPYVEIGPVSSNPKASL